MVLLRSFASVSVLFQSVSQWMDVAVNPLTRSADDGE